MSACIPHEVRELLKTEGFVLVRSSRHFVFKRTGSDGIDEVLVVSTSPRNRSQLINRVRHDIKRLNRKEVA